MPQSYHLRCSKRGVDVRENLENLVEPGEFKNVLDAFLNVREREFAAVLLNALHSFDQDGET